MLHCVINFDGKERLAYTQLTLYTVSGHVMHIMLYPFIQETGVTFQFDGTLMAFRGTLTVVSADNLAAWNIGGFKALASAFRKCQ